MYEADISELYVFKRESVKLLTNMHHTAVILPYHSYIAPSIPFCEIKALSMIISSNLPFISVAEEIK